MTNVRLATLNRTNQEEQKLSPAQVHIIYYTYKIVLALNILCMFKEKRSKKRSKKLKVKKNSPATHTRNSNY